MKDAADRPASPLIDADAST